MMIFLIDKKPVDLPVNPTDTFKLEVNFDDGNTITLLIDNELGLEFIISCYNEYETNLSNSWNAWCNPSLYDISGLFEHVANRINLHARTKSASRYIGDVSSYWSSSNEYRDYLARFSDYRLTKFDSNGIEFNVKVVKYAKEKVVDS